MARTPAITGASNKLIRSLRQSQAITGRRLDPDQLRAIVAGELDVEAARSLQGAELEERKRQFDKAYDLKRDVMRDEERAAAISGVAQLGSLGYQTFVQAPQERALLAAQTDYLKGITRDVTGTAVPAVTGGVPTAASMAGAGGELGLSEGVGAVESYTSAATGKTVSTAAPATSPLGTVAGGVGAFGVGTVASELGGESTAGQFVAGVSAGAIYGSVVPGIGTFVGGVLGGIGALGKDEKSPTVICEELHRQGYIPRRVLQLDGFYRDKHIPVEVYVGYRFIADPIVARMKVSRLVTLAVKPFGLAWSYTMANKLDSTVKVNPIRKLVGNLLLYFGIPYCRHVFRKSVEGGLLNG